jgi:hypothetical protein
LLVIFFGFFLYISDLEGGIRRSVKVGTCRIIKVLCLLEAHFSGHPTAFAIFVVARTP